MDVSNSFMADPNLISEEGKNFIKNQRSNIKIDIKN